MIIQKQWRYTVSTLQIRIDDTLKKEADALFASLGLNTSTAVRIFWGASIENAGIPFCVQHKKMPHSLQEAFMTADTALISTDHLTALRRLLLLCWRSRYV